MTARRLGRERRGRGNGVDVESDPAGEARRVRTDVIHLGRLIDEKRVDRLLHAVKVLSQNVRTSVAPSWATARNDIGFWRWLDSLALNEMSRSSAGSPMSVSPDCSGPRERWRCRLSAKASASRLSRRRRRGACPWWPEAPQRRARAHQGRRGRHRLRADCRSRWQLRFATLLDDSRGDVEWRALRCDLPSIGAGRSSARHRGALPTGSAGGSRDRRLSRLGVPAQS